MADDDGCEDMGRCRSVIFLLDWLCSCVYASVCIRCFGCCVMVNDNGGVSGNRVRVLCVRVVCLHVVYGVLVPSPLLVLFKVRVGD